MSRDRWYIHDRLLRLFDGDGYEEFDAGKYVFVKQYNAGADRWQVAVYPKAHWSKSQQWKEARHLNLDLDQQLKRHL